MRLIKSKRVKTKKHPYLNRQYYTAFLLYECHCGKRFWIRKAKARPRKSCGCLTGGKTHGLASGKKHPIYFLFGNVKGRCLNKNHKFYHRYGGRGITICEEWRTSFITFYNWAIKNGWKKGLSIERINNDGNYEPSNCKFIPRSQQARNRSTSKLTMRQVKNIRACYDSGLATNSELAKRYKITPTTMCAIVHRKIWREGGAS